MNDHDSRSMGHARWSTSCFGETARAPLADLKPLGRHLHACRASHGRLFALRCAAESLDGFLSARFVTTVAVGSLLVGLGTLLG